MTVVFITALQMQNRNEKKKLWEIFACALCSMPYIALNGKCTRVPLRSHVFLIYLYKIISNQNVSFNGILIAARCDPQ